MKGLSTSNSEKLCALHLNLLALPVSLCSLVENSSLPEKGKTNILDMGNLENVKLNFFKGLF